LKDLAASNNDLVFNIAKYKLEPSERIELLVGEISACANPLRLVDSAASDDTQRNYCKTTFRPVEIIERCSRDTKAPLDHKSGYLSQKSAGRLLSSSADTNSTALLRLRS